jgi:hypothetical protein
MFKLNDREVEIVETDFEMGEGVWVIDAVFLDDETHLTESECEELTDIYQSELYQEAYENAASRAYDSYKDSVKYGE